MLKAKFKKAAVLGMCCAVITSGSVFAMPNETSLNLDAPVMQLVPIMAVDTDYQALLELQSKIDQYVFVDHVEEIAEAGFKVTNTSPMGDYVEVGILPYTEENANYLYQLFGQEKVKVVEGIQAVLIPMPEIIPIMEKLDIGIQLNGEKLELDVVPIIENERTLVPLRGVMEKLGAKVDWDEQKRMVEIDTDELSIQLVVDEDTAKLIKKSEGALELSVETIKLDVPTRIVDGRTFIPGRFVAETLGAEVNWDETLRIVHIVTQTSSQSGTIIEQWNKLNNQEFAVSAAPIGPSELGHNDQYVFALPARYNFAFPTGYEEVEDILNGDALQPLPLSL